MARASPDLPTLTLPLKFIMPMAPVGSAVANGTGEFVVTLSPAQTDGGTLTAIAIDRAGNNGPATNFPASDSGLPAVPAITAIEDDVGRVQGILRRAAPRTTPRRHCAAPRISALPLKFSLMAIRQALPPLTPAGTGSLRSRRH